MMDRIELFSIILVGCGLLLLAIGSRMMNPDPVSIGLTYGVGFSYILFASIIVLDHRIIQQKKMIEDLQEHLERLGFSDKEK